MPVVLALGKRNRRRRFVAYNHLLSYILFICLCILLRPDWDDIDHIETKLLPLSCTSKPLTRKGLGSSITSLDVNVS